MRTVVCGIGNTHRREPATAAASLARATRSRLVLFHCVPPLRLRLADGRDAQHDRPLRYANASLSRLACRVGESDRVGAEVEVARPTDGLLRAAGRPGTLAVVVGTGRGEVIGDVAGEVAASAATPVLVVPPDSDGELEARQTVVAGYDGAPAAHAAITSLIEALAPRPRTVVATALADADPVPSRAVPIQDGLEWRWLHGAPGEALRELADNEDADLIAVGANSRERPPTALLGSTVRHLCHTANRPVLVASHEVARRRGTAGRAEGSASRRG